MDCLRRRSLSRDCLRSLARPFSRDLRERHRCPMFASVRWLSRGTRNLVQPRHSDNSGGRLRYKDGRLPLGSDWTTLAPWRKPSLNLDSIVICRFLYLGDSSWDSIMLNARFFRIRLHVEIEVDCWNLFYRCGYDELMRNLLASNMIRSLFHSVRII